MYLANIGLCRSLSFRRIFRGMVMALCTSIKIFGLGPELLDRVKQSFISLFEIYQPSYPSLFSSLRRCSAQFCANE